MTLEEYLSKPDEPLAARIGSLCSASVTNEKFVELGRNLLKNAKPQELVVARSSVNKLEALLRAREGKVKHA
jgi:hypothetical protein